MKWVQRLLRVCGFLFQYIVPVLIFGRVVPYTHGALAAGLTRAGYFAGALVLYIIARKARESILEKPKGAVRGILLSLFPLAFWLIVNAGAGWLVGIATALAEYWKNILIFIIIGRLFYIGEEIISASLTDDRQSTGKEVITGDADR